MNITGAGGGLMLALAAGLWLVYLVPNWLRRSEFTATERNAVRLQRTIRVLAETSEGPALPVPRPKPLVAPPVVTRPTMSQGRRLRRSRAIASLALLAGLATAVVQLGVAIAAGWSPGGMLVVGTGAVLTISSLAMIRRLAAIRPHAAAPRQRALLQDIQLPVETVVREWTPVPVPRPIARPEVVPSTMADPRIAAAAAVEARRREQRRTDREVAPLPAPFSMPTLAGSRFAAMGVVEDAGAPAIADLDAVLARRRA